MGLSGGSTLTQGSSSNAHRRDEMKPLTHIHIFLTFWPFLKFLSPPPSVHIPDSGACSPSFQLSYVRTASPPRVVMQVGIQSPW